MSSTGTALQNSFDELKNIALKKINPRLDYLIEKKRIQNSMRTIEKNEKKKKEIDEKIIQIQKEIDEINSQPQPQPQREQLTSPYTFSRQERKILTLPAGYNIATMREASNGQDGGRKRKSRRRRAKITKRRKSRSKQKSKRRFR
jgi:hypothetical protein